MTARWQAVVTYRADAGPVDVTHDIEELEHLQNLIEAGPDWNAIDAITITLSRRSYDVTVEQAEQL